MCYNQIMTFIYLTGGAKNGKSTLAQKLACRLSLPGQMYYLATMEPHDREDEERIARHRRERQGLGFITIERSRELAPLAEAEGFYLVDSVTALLANVMFGPSFDPDAPQKVARDLLAFISRAGGAVFVSDGIGLDGGSYDSLTRQYMAGLAYVDRQVAAACHVVAELAAGLPIVYKGSLEQC